MARCGEGDGSQWFKEFSVGPWSDEFDIEDFVACDITDLSANNGESSLEATFAEIEETGDVMESNFVLILSLPACHLLRLDVGYHVHGVV